MAETPAPGPPQPLPKPVQYVILAAMIAIIGGIFYVIREPTPEIHGVHDAIAYQGTATFEVSGEVAPTSEANLALRAMDGMESFTLIDDTGQMVVYHPPEVRAPSAGDRVRVEGSKLPIAGVGALGFVATSVRRDR